MTVLPVSADTSRPGSVTAQWRVGVARGFPGLVARAGEVFERMVTLLVLGLMVVSGGVIAFVTVAVMAGFIR